MAGSKRGFRGLRVAWRVALAAAAAASLLGGSAQAKGKLETGFLEVLYGSADAGLRDQWFDRTVDAHAGVVRLHVFWRSAAPTEPTDPLNPADPAYQWGTLDGSVTDAAERGLKVLLTITSVPDWAEGANRPGNVNPGSWKPNPNAYGEFAQAVAERYSGDFLGLPRVKHYQAWNEQNLEVHLSPQYEDGKQYSVGHYRRMLNAFTSGIKAVDPTNQAVTGGTAPYGDPPGGKRTRPLVFLRKLMCLKGRKKLADSPCPTKPRFDILAHHPINTSGGPHRSAVHPDDASTPDFKNVVRTLRAGERASNVPGGNHPAWATELWWESNPPDNRQGIPVARHARWLEDALYVLWKQGAKVVINLQIRDAEFNQQTAFERNTTGIFFHSGEKKPAFRAWRFPFVTHRRSSKQIGAWGKAPAAGTLVIERKRDGKWRKLKQRQVDAGEVFTEALKLGGAAKLRARVGATTSLAWNQSS